MAARRQTQSYLRSLFAQRGIAPRHQYGQNFLIDLNLHEVIAATAQVGPGDVVLEVGPGAGAMTTLMADRGAAVVAVEIDPAMAQLTREAVADRPNVRVVQADALAGKHAMNPEVLEQVRAGLAVAPDRRFKLVANLPYQVATPILSNLLVHPELCPALMVATIQRELAERIRAPKGTGDYSALSVLVQGLSEPEIVRILPPSVFWPRPKVESAIIKIVPQPEKRAEIGDVPWFQGVVRQVFLHRRKHLRGVVFSLYRDRWTKPEADQFLEGLGLDGSVRAEDLTVAQFRALAQALQRRFGAEPQAAPSAPDTEGPPDA